MCIAIPKKVIALHDTASGMSADVQNGEQVERVDISLLESVSPGDYVLVFRGNALRVIDAQEAAKIERAFACVDKVMQGCTDSREINRTFEDLESETINLPPHLKRLVGKKVI